MYWSVCLGFRGLEVARCMLEKQRLGSWGTLSMTMLLYDSVPARHVLSVGRSP